ncbi:MAG: hypothetical protein FJ102_26360 [Deltaproteobacteria bacterium]|nr:hypothetical protein [Deltaproteobacteria bacterium]
MTLALILACNLDADDTGNKDGADEAASSCDRVETSLPLDEVTPLGFAAAEVWAWLEGTHSTSFSLVEDESERDVAITVDSLGTATWVDLEPAESSGGIEPAIDEVCADSLEIDGTIDFVVSDGTFDEEWTVALSVDQVAAASARLEVALDGLSGSYTVPGGMTDGCDTSNFVFEMGFSQGGGPSGELMLWCEGSDGDVAWAGQDLLGSWGEGESE